MRFLNTLRTHAASQDAAAPVNRWGIVQSVDTSSMTAKVTLQPENVLTDWLPIVSPMSGNGWGLIHPPALGTQVLCAPDAGDGESYVILGGTWNTGAMPPAGVACGELWLVHSTGSAVKMTNDGKVTISDAAGASLSFLNGGTIALTGTLAVTGAIKVNGTIVSVP
jgi:uncharacterized protein involved in type VI secretion and phage assembly